MSNDRCCNDPPEGAPAPDQQGCGGSRAAPRERGAAPPEPVVEALVANHREFLAFLERRVGDRALAEDLLQEAFVRSIDRLGDLRDDDSARAWFYRTLRNAVTDHHRRHAAAARRLETLAEALDPDGAEDPELQQVVCACVGRVAELLKPEYAEALRRIELDGLPVVEFAREVGISESNAGVRVFRARQALRREVSRSCGTCAEHGCFDCTCS
jgi:RNA polymerase sigma factor (sigma-70 family)